MPKSMCRQTSNGKIALHKCLDNAKRRGLALHLLKEGNVTQATNMDKSTVGVSRVVSTKQL